MSTNEDREKKDLRPPEFSMRETLQLPPATDDDRDEFHAPLEGYVMTENRSGGYVFVWYQDPQSVATRNGGYSIPVDLLASMDEGPGHLEQFWIIDEESDLIRRFPRSFFEDGDIRTKVNPNRSSGMTVAHEQYAVDLSMAAETHDLQKVDIPDTSSAPTRVVGE